MKWDGLEKRCNINNLARCSNILYIIFFFLGIDIHVC